MHPQGVSKLQTFVFNRLRVLQVHQEIISFHQSTKNEKSMRIYERYAKYCLIACKMVNVLYLFVAVGTMLNPIVIKMLTGQVVLPYGFKLPFLDEYSLFGYLINFVHHGMQSFVVACGFIYTDGLYAVFIIHIYCVFDVLVVMMEEFDELAEKEDAEPQAIEKQLDSIIKLHQKLVW
jgi:7tm Odorant receptor